jgi:hypothetical protein
VNKLRNNKLFLSKNHLRMRCSTYIHFLDKEANHLIGIFLKPSTYIFPHQFRGRIVLPGGGLWIVKWVQLLALLQAIVLARGLKFCNLFLWYPLKNVCSTLFICCFYLLVPWKNENKTTYLIYWELFIKREFF